MTDLRTDIQALRGLAVLLVVLHHALPEQLRAGYLGVDIFFVISGYLITGLIARDLERGRFSFAAFYMRRAQRLLPAAFVVFFATACLAVFFLDAKIFDEFAAQLLGAVTFTSNLVLWRQGGYFDSPAALKPLLHVWSLSLEEQYYLLLPLALVFTPRRLWLAGTLVLLVASAGLCLALASSDPSAAFYLLPTRAWELAIGSLGALLAPAALGAPAARRLVAAAFWPALGALLVLPIVPIGSLAPAAPGAAHPGLDALLVCLATLAVILRRHPLLAVHPGARGLAWVGDWSYSLYLVHWPLFAFITNAYVETIPLATRLGAVLLALGLGYLLYRSVEAPVRRRQLRPSAGPAAAAIALALAIVALPVSVAAMNTPAVDYAQIRRPNYGLHSLCNALTDEGALRAECQTAEQPALLVWGDSFAMQIVPGIVDTAGVGVAQATRSSCAPFIGLAPINDGANNRPWAEDCLAHNQAVLDYAARTPSIEVVVLSGSYTKYIGDPSERVPWWRQLAVVGTTAVERGPGLAGTLAAMRTTVAQLRAAGKRVVVVAPPPVEPFDIGRCLERKATGLVILGGHRDCAITVAGAYRTLGPVLGFLERVERDMDVPIFDFHDALCSAATCATTLAGVFVYGSDIHFSYDGSVALARTVALGPALYGMAR